MGLKFRIRLSNEEAPELGLELELG
jgi:hypothetical protein